MTAMWATHCMSYTPAGNATVCKPTSRLLTPCTAWQQVYHVQNADLSMWKCQRYKGLFGCSGLNQKLYTSCMCRFMWGRGLLQKPQLQPCQLASTAKPLLMAHRYSMSDCRFNLNNSVIHGLACSHIMSILFQLSGSC